MYEKLIRNLKHERRLAMTRRRLAEFNLMGNAPSQALQKFYADKIDKENRVIDTLNTMIREERERHHE